MKCLLILQGGDADLEETHFLLSLTNFLGLDGPYLALLGPLLASPSSGFNSLDPRESDIDLDKQS